MEDLETSNGTFSMISHEGKNVLNMHVQQEFKFNEIAIGGGLNIVFPEKQRPPGLSLVEIQYIQYDNSVYGIELGRMKAETYGYGLILDEYNSSPATTYFNIKRAGIKAYTKFWSPSSLYVMYTGTGIIGTRFSCDLYNILEKNPLVAGLNFVKDTDGVQDINKATINKDAYGYSVDLGFKLINPWMDSYIECGALSNTSTAMTIGTKLDAGKIFDFMVEYRILGENFIPGLFNSNYEIAPRDIKIKAPATTGYFAGAEARLLPFGILSFGFEGYRNRDAVARVALAFNKIAGTSGVISYEQILQPNIPYKVSAVITQPLNSLTKLVIYYEQVGLKESSYTLSYIMNI